MENKIVDAFRVKNMTILALNNKRRVQDLACSSVVIDGHFYDVNWIHPNEFISIEATPVPSELIGKTIQFVS